MTYDCTTTTCCKKLHSFKAVVVYERPPLETGLRPNCCTVWWTFSLICGLAVFSASVASTWVFVFVSLHCSSDIRRISLFTDPFQPDVVIAHRKLTPWLFHSSTGFLLQITYSDAICLSPNYLWFVFKTHISSHLLKTWNTWELVSFYLSFPSLRTAAPVLHHSKTSQVSITGFTAN